MKNNLLIILLGSLVFPITFSRVITTYDPPSNYTFYQEDEGGGNSFEKEYETDSSLAFAYEHSFINRNIFHFYTGGEFMLSRSSSENISLHSLYVKPSVSMTDNILLFLKLGYCFLNKEDLGLPLSNGLIISFGFEYDITDRLSLGLSHSFYDLFEEKRISPNEIPFPFPLEGNIPNTNVDLKYNKIGFSVIYGFDIEKKERI